MKRLLKAAPILLATAILGAGDLTGGIQLGFASPMGDAKTLTDKGNGAQFAVYGLWDLEDGHSLRFKLDGVANSGYPGVVDTPVGPRDLMGLVKVQTATSSLGADYLYFVNGTFRDGFYAGAGLAYTANNLRIEVGTLSLDRTENSAGYSLYVGNYFTRHWSMELSYRSSKYKADSAIGQFNYTFNTLVLSGAYTF